MGRISHNSILTSMKNPILRIGELKARFSDVPRNNQTDLLNETGV